MSLYLKPHTARVYPPLGPVDPVTKVVQATSWGTEPSQVPCKLEPMNIETAFEATGVEMKRPYRLLCELADYNTFAINARVVWLLSSLTLRVISRKRHEAYPLTAHAEIMLEVEEYV